MGWVKTEKGRICLPACLPASLPRLDQILYSGIRTKSCRDNFILAPTDPK